MKMGRSVEELNELVHCRGYLSVHTRCFVLGRRSTLEFRTDLDREFLESLLVTIRRGYDNISYDSDYRN